MLDIKKYKIYILTLIIFLLISSSFNLNIAKAEQNLVIDNANILSEPVIEYILNVNNQLEEKINSNIYVRAVTSLDEKKIEDVASNMFKELSLDKNSENNILILLAPNEGKAFIEVGDGLKDILSKNRLRDIEYDLIVSNFKLGLFDTGLVTGFDSLLNIISEKNNIDIESNFVLNEESPKDGSSITWKFIVVILLIIFVDLLVFKASLINTISRVFIGFRGEYKGNMSPYRTSERYRGAGTGPRDDWPSDLKKKNKYGNW